MSGLSSGADVGASLRRSAFLYRLARLLRWRHLRIDGFKVIGYRHDVPKHISSLLARGDYEAPERLALQHLLRRDDRVLEIGGCVGIVALTAAQIVGETNVVSYEPNPDAAKIAQENFALNARAIRLRNAAVGAEAGSLQLSVGPDSWLGASAMRDNRGTSATVPLVAISDAVADARPTVLVVDVEGMESVIVPAAPLDDVRAVMIEFHPDVIGETGVETIRDDLRGRGFALRPDLSAAATEVWERPQASRS
jgi:FkbM family methyltransferase